MSAILLSSGPIMHDSVIMMEVIGIMNPNCDLTYEFHPCQRTHSEGSRR